MGSLEVLCLSRILLYFVPSPWNDGFMQVVTITGENFPEDPSRLIVSVRVDHNGTNSSRVIELKQCAPLTKATGRTTLECVTPPMPALAAQGQLARYAQGKGRAPAGESEPSYPASVATSALLSGDGDSLRFVSVADSSNFGDNFRPGIYLSTKASGLEHMVANSGWANAQFSLAVAAMFYNPKTRKVTSLRVYSEKSRLRFPPSDVGDCIVYG